MKASELIGLNYPVKNFDGNPVIIDGVTLTRKITECKELTSYAGYAITLENADTAIIVSYAAMLKLKNEQGDN